jgi:hypothetical protein
MSLMPGQHHSSGIIAQFFHCPLLAIEVPFPARVKHKLPIVVVVDHQVPHVRPSSMYPGKVAAVGFTLVVISEGYFFRGSIVEKGEDGKGVNHQRA